MPKTRREREVWEACDELWEEIRDEGLTISALTGDKLKEKLVDLGYRRGNQNQLYQYRNSWQENRGIEESEELAKEEHKSVLSERVQKAIARVHAEINTEADERILEVRKDAERQTKIAQEERDLMRKEYDVMTHQLEELQHENKDLKSIENKLNGEIVTLRQELELTKSGKDNAEEHLLREKESFVMRLKELEKYNKEVKEESVNQVLHLEKLHAKENSNLMVLHEKERHLYITENANLKEVIKKLEKENRNLIIAEQRYQDNIKELKRKVKALESEMDSLVNELKTVTTKIHNIIEKNSSLNANVRELEVAYDNCRKELNKVQANLLAEKERSGNLTGQLQILKSELQQAARHKVKAKADNK